jgi:tetratricopeptide (TPR) repeat protein
MTLLHLLWQGFKAIFQAICSWMTTVRFVTLMTLAVSGYFIWQDLKNDVITIEPIEVPKTLADTGYTPEVASYRLRDALNVYAQGTSPKNDGINASFDLNSLAHDDDSLSSNLDLSISAGHELPDIVVPQIGLSIRAIASSIRGVVHRKGYVVSGELTAQEKKYALRLRANGQEIFSSGYEADSADDLMTYAAPSVMEKIRPASHAIARYHDRNEEGFLKAREIIARYDMSDINVRWAYLLMGKHARESNNYQQAEEMFSKAITSKLDSEQPHMQLGLLRLRQGRLDDAIAQFQNVIDINSKSAIAYNNIGVALVTKANRSKEKLRAALLHDAILIYKQAIEKDPGYVLSYNNLGLAYFHSEDFDNAIDSYRSAVEIAPKYLLARWNLAYALNSQGLFDAAETEYRAAIDLAAATKQLAILHTYLGDVLRNKAGVTGNLDEAVLEYRRAIELSCYGWAHHNLGLIHWRQGKNDDAIVEFQKATACDPEDKTLGTMLEQVRLEQVRPAQEASATIGRASR